MTSINLECACLKRGPRYPDAVEIRDLGRDETEGRFADVAVEQCKLCQRLWLRYQVEYEAFTASGRWAEAVIDKATAETMTAERAAAYLDAADWRIYGGSYCGHRGKRLTGPRRMHWAP